MIELQIAAALAATREKSKSAVIMLLRLVSASAIMSELAEATGFTVQNATGLVDRLEKEGLVQRSFRQGQDRRTVIVELTEKGRAEVAKMRETFNGEGAK